MAAILHFALAVLFCTASGKICLSESEDLDLIGTSLLQVKTDAISIAPKYFWSGKNGDALRTGGSKEIVDLEILKKGPAWSFLDLPHGVIRAAPLIDDKLNIYLSTVQDRQGLLTPGKHGTVRKFTADGKMLWSYNDSAEVPCVPALYEGKIYFTNADGLVTALDMETGKDIWRKSALVDQAKGSSGDTWSMSAAEGVLISAVSSNMENNDYVVALDAKTGDVKWSFQPDTLVYNSLAPIKDGFVAFSDVTGKLYKLDLKTGQLAWKVGPAKSGEAVNVGGSTGGTIVGPNGIAYVTSNVDAGGIQEGRVTAFNFSDGSLLWRESTGYEANNGAVFGMIGGRPALAIGVGTNPDLPNPIDQIINKVPDNSSSLAEKKGRVISLDAETGKPIWSHEVPAWHGWGAGDTVRQICLPDSFGNAAIGGDGTVFVGFQSGHFMGINDKDGNGQISPDEIASFNTGRCAQGTPAIAPGMLAFTPCHGLYVFKA